MTAAAIRLEGLGKQYRLGLQIQSNTIRDVFSHALRAGGNAIRTISGRGNEDASGPEWFWALRDVSFEVPCGQVVGIIGSNGAGKSTLLKVLSRITEPTTGIGTLRGRIGSLIEVGTGFHSELTGRENTFLSGAILGMRRAEIARKFDEIVAFADVERFIDTPIKHFSSGMQLRLGFAVAAHLETEILMVDEVLAVGDAAFQRKCLATMSRLAREGRTIVFVSHNAAAVKMLCDRAIWLNRGEIAADGPPGDILAQYLTASAGNVPERVWDPAARSDGSSVALRRVAARAEQDSIGSRITTDTPFLIQIDYWTDGQAGRLAANFALFNEQEILLLEATEPGRRDSVATDAAGHHSALCHLPGSLFARGVYRAEIAILDGDGNAVTTPEELFFTILGPDEDADGPARQRASVIQPRLRWDSELILGDQS